MNGTPRGGSLLKSLDSLVDIVSNNLGILIILAAFMALFGLINPADLEAPPEERPETMPPPKLLVPWSHATHKNPVLFHVRNGRLLHLDLTTFFQELARQPVQERPEPITIPGKELETRFYPVTNQIYCLEFHPNRNAGETWLESLRPGSAWQQARTRFPPEKFYYFFWVAGDSFELFREVRDRLWGEQMEVGWKPAVAGAPLEICNGFEGSTGFRPQ